MDSEDDSPQSISDDEEAGELLEIKPPQAKIFKHSHHQHDKHASSRQVYMGLSSGGSSSRHRKSHRSHRHDDGRPAFKDRFVEKVAKKSRHHKDYEIERPPLPPPPLPISRRHLDECHLKDRYEKEAKASRGHHKDHEPPPEKRSRRHAPVALGKRPERLPRDRYEMAAKSGRSAAHVHEYEPPQPAKEAHYEEHKRKKSSHSHHSRRADDKQKAMDRARLLNDENFRFEVIDDDDDVHSDVEMKAPPPVQVEEEEAEEEEEEGEASSDSSSSSSSSSEEDDDSSESSSEEEGEEDDDCEEVEPPKKAAAISIDNTPEDEDDEDEDCDDMKSSSTKDEETPPRVVATNADVDTEIELEKDTLPSYFPAIQGCRSVEEFQCLNRIEEGTYGVVYRAREKRTDKIVALKRLKMEKEKEGFPITSLREINTLLKAQHPNVVTVKEIVVGNSMNSIFIVMEYVEHDLKSLMETMKQKKTAFTTDEVKCLMTQLLRAVNHLHDNWILHRDLKTSNLLFSHTGLLKVGDFGLAREYGSPLKHYTPVVVTLWYRAPELLLGTKEYSTSVDMWSVGCIFAEFLRMEPLFPGKTEIDQLHRIFKALGTPTEADWPDYPKFPVVQKGSFPRHPPHSIRSEFKYLSEKGYDLLRQFLMYDTKKRVTAEAALLHDYFAEPPVAINPAMFPTWPAKSDPSYRKAIASSPKPPSGGKNFMEQLGGDDGFYIAGDRNPRNHHQSSFTLKF